MSSPKFLVFKLKDLRIPALILLIIVALFAFFMVKNKTTQTFAPSDGYEDGKYIAGITLSDAEMDVVVEVTDHTIASISLSGLDETTSALYGDLVSGIDYINTYVTTTQSLTLPQSGEQSIARMILMDAVRLALSDQDQEGTRITHTYENLDLSMPNSLTTDDIFVDEFSDEDFTAESSDQKATD